MRYSVLAIVLIYEILVILEWDCIYQKEINRGRWITLAGRNMGMIVLSSSCPYCTGSSSYLRGI